MMADQKQTKSQWFDRLESPLLHYAYGILRNDDAQDVVQEAFIRFFREKIFLHFIPLVLSSHQ